MSENQNNERVLDSEKARAMAEAENPHQEAAKELYKQADQYREQAAVTDDPDEQERILENASELEKDAGWGHLNEAEQASTEAAEKYDAEQGQEKN